jgi:hypothetical protein
MKLRIYINLKLLSIGMVIIHIFDGQMSKSSKNLNCYLKFLNHKKHLKNIEKTPEAIMLAILNKTKGTNNGIFALGD